jgi:hypothetical protein
MQFIMTNTIEKEKRDTNGDKVRMNLKFFGMCTKSNTMELKSSPIKLNSNHLQKKHVLPTIRSKHNFQLNLKTILGPLRPRPPQEIPGGPRATYLSRSQGKESVVLYHLDHVRTGTTEIASGGGSVRRRKRNLICGARNRESCVRWRRREENTIVTVT